METAQGFLNWHVAAMVALTAIIGPWLLKFFSPIILVLLSPFLVILLLIAFVAASVLVPHALDSNKVKSSPHRRRGQASKQFSFSTPAAWQAVLTRSQWSFTNPQILLPILPESPSVSASLNDILILILRDFVLSWYKGISPAPAFPASVSTTLRYAVKELAGRVEKLDMPSLIALRVLPKVNAHIDHFKESEKVLRGVGLERRLTQSDELDLLLASRYAGRGGRLHPAVNNLSTMLTKPTEESYLRNLVERALPLVIPAHETGSRAVCVCAREIMTVVIFAPLLEMFGDPDFWNRMIDQFAGAAIRQQKLVHRVRTLLDSQSGPTAGLSMKSSPILRGPGGGSEAITVRTSPRQFESFLKSISRCDSLLDARRLKNDIIAEIRRARALIESEPGAVIINGESVQKYQAFAERLGTAKHNIEHRIIMLGGSEDSAQSMINGRISSRAGQVALQDILSSQEWLSYFMEFMDRRHRSLLVQFWLTVETFKDPLGSVAEEPQQDEQPRSTEKEDIRLIVDLYFSEDRPTSTAVLSAVSPRHVDILKSFVYDTSEDVDHESPIQSTRVRQTVLLAQRQAEDAMADDFEDFKRSELWFRVTSQLRPVALSAVPVTRLPLETTTPIRQPLHHSHSTPTPRKSSHRNPDTVRSRIYPTFILPSTSENPKIEKSEPVTSTKSRPRLRLTSFGSDVSSLMSNRTSPVLSNSMESLPTSPSVPHHHSALDFLTSDPNPSAAGARAPLFDDPEIVREEVAQANRMEAIQAALTDIIDDEQRSDGALGGAYEDHNSGSTSHSSPDLLGKHRDLLSEASYQLERSLPSLTPPVASVSSQRKRAISLRSMIDTEADDESVEHSDVILAAPGDLLLSHEIIRLEDKIGKLQSQEALLEALTRKAELTGDDNELRILARSKTSLAKELRELNFQKTQYEQQDQDNQLSPGRTKILITSSVANESENDGKQVIRYLVEVQQLNTEGSVTSGWVVSRRYNEFFSMHQRLKERYTSVKTLDFPGKRLVTSLSSSFVDTRKAALEKYLQGLVRIPLVCESEELRAFLSRQSTFSESGAQIVPKTPISFPGQQIVRTMYRSVAESIDDMFFGPSMLDIMIQRLSRQAAEYAGIVGSGVHDEDLVANAVKSPHETILQLPGDLKALGGESSTSSFTAPICDFVLSVFELDEKKNWLRRQAVVVILQQVLGGTIERKLRETVKAYVDESHIVRYLQSLKDALWPGGQWRASPMARTADDKNRSKEEAHRKLSALFPDLAGNMIGRSNAKRGARRIFAVLQNRRLNQHIVYTVLDEVFEALFPELTQVHDIT